MLAAKMLAGVALEVNLRNPLHFSNKVHKQGDLPGFVTQNRYHQLQSSSISGPTKGLIFPKN